MFVLTGTVDSADEFFASVEIDMSPVAQMIGHAVIPVAAFPCEIKEGDVFYIVKLREEVLPAIICSDITKKNKEEE
jgi:hypothetical protein|tara:strand:- start:491 stop:718 length:228 start_codon:yes stop_codon:yes gene_type:complete